MKKPNTYDPGFIYRGKYTEVSLDGKRIRLVPDETYVIPFLQDPTNIEVELKNESRSIRLGVTASEYYAHISIGRLTFTDPDPYT